MRVVVAGASGLLGRYVVAHLREGGHEVVGLSRSGRDGCAVTDYSIDSLAPLLEGADGVVDLAASRPRPGSRADMAATLAAGIHLVEAALQAGVPVLVQASSVSVYGPDARLPITEASPTHPRTAYGLTKLAVERWARLEDYAGIRTVSLRLSDLFGAGDDSGWLASTYLRLAAAGEDLPVHDPLGPARDLLYAGDAARAVELALTTETAGGAVNVAGLHLLTPAQLAQACSDELGGQVVGGDPAWRHVPPLSTVMTINTERAQAVLGFVPGHDVRSALQEIRASCQEPAVPGGWA